MSAGEISNAYHAGLRQDAQEVLYTLVRHAEQQEDYYALSHLHMALVYVGEMGFALERERRSER
jgi:hypothetical protein